jgi:hypothetical protein
VYQVTDASKIRKELKCVVSVSVSFCIWISLMFPSVSVSNVACIAPALCLSGIKASG